MERKVVIVGAGQAAAYEDVHRHAGVRLLAGSGISAIEAIDDGLELHTTDGHTIGIDGVLISIGLLPSQELAAAGLVCDNGIAVDENARASHVSTLYDTPRAPGIGAERHRAGQERGGGHVRQVEAPAASALVLVRPT